MMKNSTEFLLCWIIFLQLIVESNFIIVTLFHESDSIKIGQRTVQIFTQITPNFLSMYTAMFNSNGLLAHPSFSFNIFLSR